MDCSLPGSSVHGIFPGKNTGVDCHFLLQRIFPIKTQMNFFGKLNQLPSFAFIPSSSSTLVDNYKFPGYLDIRWRGALYEGHSHLTQKRIPLIISLNWHLLLLFQDISEGLATCQLSVVVLRKSRIWASESDVKATGEMSPTSPPTFSSLYPLLHTDGHLPSWTSSATSG